MPDAARQDPTFHRTAGSELGRDGARVPLPWAPVGDGLGFGPDPWLPQPESFAGITAYTMSCGTGETVLVAANLGESEIGFDELSRGELLLASGQNAVVNDRLSVDSAVWLRLT